MLIKQARKYSSLRNLPLRVFLNTLVFVEWSLLPRPTNLTAGYSIFPFTTSSLRHIQLFKTHQCSGKVIRKLILSLLTVLPKPLWFPFAPEWHKMSGWMPGPFQDNSCAELVLSWQIYDKVIWYYPESTLWYSHISPLIFKDFHGTSYCAKWCPGPAAGRIVNTFSVGASKGIQGKNSSSALVTDL